MQIAATLAAQGYTASRAATTPSGADGGSLFSSAAADFAATLRAGEETAVASMQGQADPHALVTALTQAELAVETAVTLRNRVVEAYQEILRMPV
jgi:flagellar hook-basal body complex protein FliE